MYFEIKGQLLTLSFDQEALKEIKKQSTGNVTINISPVTIKSTIKAYDITMSYKKSGKTKYITSLGEGKAYLFLPYSLKKEEVAEGFYGVFVDKKGNLVAIIESIYDEKQKGVTYSFHRFLVYGIAYKEPTKTNTDS